MRYLSLIATTKRYQWEVWSLKRLIQLILYIRRGIINDNQDALFVTERKFKANGDQPRRISTDGIRWTLKRLASRGGITKSVYPHNLRHSFAMNLLENGAPMEAIQEFLGHSNLEHTKVYAQLTTNMKRSIYDKYN